MTGILTREEFERMLAAAPTEEEAQTLLAHDAAQRAEIDFLKSRPPIGSVRIPPEFIQPNRIIRFRVEPDGRTLWLEVLN